MFGKILVPLDGSALAERALPVALDLAQPAQGELTLLRAPSLQPIPVSEFTGVYNWAYPQQTKGEALEEVLTYLDHARSQWARDDVEVRIKAAVGDPAAVILDTAVASGTQLICMTTHGYSGLTRWMLGSVTERVLRAAPCPVLVVHESRPIRHIVITLDGSNLAERALDPGLEVARRLGARVTLLQVASTVPVPYDVVYQLEVMESDVNSYLGTSAVNEARSYLDAVAARLTDSGVSLAMQVLEGFAAQSIVDYAADQDADLMVMATHGRTGLRRWAYGSVTEKVLRSGQCALLVVRPGKEELRGD